MSTPENETLDKLTYPDFQIIHDNHWQIEQFHRAVKQVCHIETFQVRNTKAIKNHIFCAIRAFVQLEFMRLQNIIVNWYDVQKNLFNEVIRTFIQTSIANQNEIFSKHSSIVLSSFLISIYYYLLLLFNNLYD